jgi:putative membrane protein insertion efficiency factor
MTPPQRLVKTFSPSRRAFFETLPGICVFLQSNPTKYHSSVNYTVFQPGKSNTRNDFFIAPTQYQRGNGRSSIAPGKDSYYSSSMADSTGRFRRLIRNIFLLPVHIYRFAISPFLGPSCIYSPTCSAYMLDAVHKHGILKGFLLGIARILRCNRAFMGGPDPVPEQFSWKRIRDPYIIFRKRRIKEKPVEADDETTQEEQPTDPSTTP